jgi:SAM-dependent methyltransferase
MSVGHMQPQESFEDRWRKRFEEFASDSDDDAGIAGWSETGLAARLRHFQRCWPGDRADARWLDAGCGAGTYTRYLSDRGLRAFGMDYSLPSLGKARARGGAAGWANADVTRLPVGPGSLDGAICFGVTQALRDSAPAVRELVAAVRPGGQIWIDALNARCIPHLVDTLRRRLTRVPIHLRYESPTALCATMRQHGVTEVRCHWLPILPSRLQRLQWCLETRLVVSLLRMFPLVGSLVSHSFVISGRRVGAED